MLAIATLVTLGVAVQQRYRVTLAIDEALGGHTNDFDRLDDHGAEISS